jgi:peptidoglycan/xylan/chitin deacetylase (PgdA/CDA1 family)
MSFGVMFHHFHSEDHVARPGSIGTDDLDRMISYLRKRFEILDPDVFLEKLLKGTLKATETVLTFDDSLLSQFDVALPVLEEQGIKGLFNVYSSVFTGNPDPLELFAIFRASEYPDFDEFWSVFLSTAEHLEPGSKRRLSEEFPAEWLATFLFYTDNERKFRFFRDRILGKEKYDFIMMHLISESSRFTIEEAVRNAWMGSSHLQSLVSGGHAIGLHSHTHPTEMASLSEENQRGEYLKNKNWLEDNLQVQPDWVAHPCGSYSEVTLKILGELGVAGGFRSSLTPGNFGSPLEVPREDHANLMKKVNQKN